MFRSPLTTLSLLSWPALGLLSVILLSGELARAGGFDRAIDRVMPRVVKLYGLGAGQQAGYGTGIVVSSEGYIVTVYSLLLDARNLRVVMQDGTLYEAKVVLRDAKRQLALLKLKALDVDEAEALREGVDAKTDELAATLSTLPFYSLNCQNDHVIDAVHQLQPGDWILAAGNPFRVATGAESMSLAHGVFSTRTHLDARRRLRDFPYTGEVLVFDAITSNPGAPGSALVNLDGDLLGMVGRLVVSNRTHTHLNYAIPIGVLCDFYETGMKSVRGESIAEENANEAIRKFEHGIKLARTGYKKVLPFVERVKPGSPGSKAGIKRDDLILSVNGRDVADVSAFDARLATLPTGKPMELVIRRGRRLLTVTVEWPIQ